ncbi:hypothetical protein lerEdw1_019716 [Lerista edwardsae]|nr:hypothetical protein lerEdw1_019716 [Lerista edwardsae]
MGLLWALLSQVAAIAGMGLGLLLAWAAYYHFSTTEMPPGICQPFKVRLLHIVMLTSYGLVHPDLGMTMAMISESFSLPDAYERVCRHFALKCDVVVVSVGYRLAPEHGYPAQFEDTLKAAEFFLKNVESHGVDPARVAISGDGIGATLAAFVTQKLVEKPDLPKLRAQLLIGPFLQALNFNLFSYQQNRFVPIITHKDIVRILLWYITRIRCIVELGQHELHLPEGRKLMYKDWLSPDNIPKELLMRGHYCEFQPSTEPTDNINYIMKILTETTCSPLLAEDAVISQLPETFILTCEFDVLRDDGLLYKKRLEDHGVPVSWCHLSDGFHGLLYLFNLPFLAFPFVEKGVGDIAALRNESAASETSPSLRTPAGGWERQEGCSAPDMGFLWALSVALAELGALAGLLILAWATHFYLSYAEVPHGVGQPHKLKIVYFLLIVSTGTACRNHSFACEVRQSSPIISSSINLKLSFPAAYDNVCRYIANESDAVVLSIGYSLPHQRSQPAQFQECLDVAIYFMEHAKDYGVDPARIAIMGDSFGGLLAASICQMMVQRDNTPKPRAQILVYPCLQFVTFSLPSHMQNASVPPLLRKHILTFALQYLQKCVPMVDIVAEGCHVSKDVKMKYEKWLSPDNIPEEFKVREKKAPVSTSQFGDILEFTDLMCEKIFNPLLADDATIRQVPEMLLITAQYDVFRDEGVLYKKRLEDNRVPVSWCHLEDGFHGVLGFINDPLFASPCTKRGMDRLVSYIRDL